MILPQRNYLEDSVDFFFNLKVKLCEGDTIHKEVP